MAYPVLLDVDVAVLIATILQEQGYDVIPGRDLGLSRAADSEVLDVAASTGRVLLTHNRDDFFRLAEQRYLENRPHAGILVAVRGNPVRLARSLRRWLDDPPEGPMEFYSAYLPNYREV